MKNLPEIFRKSSVAEMLQTVLLVGYISTLTLYLRLNNVMLILLFFSLVLTFRFQVLKQYITPVLVFTSVYLVSFIGMAYTIDPHEGWLVLERQLAILLTPILFLGAFRMTQGRFLFFLKIYFLTVSVICMYLLALSAKDFLNSEVTISEWFVPDNLYHAFAKPIDMHATYLSLFVGQGIFVGFYWLLMKDRWWVKILVFLCILILVTTLSLLSSRTVILTVLLVLIFVFPFFVGRIKNKFLLFFAGCAILLTCYFIIRESSFITNRFTAKVNEELRMTSFLRADSTYKPMNGGATRADRWYCAIELISERPFTGYGTGSEKHVLVQKYQKYNLQNAILNNYDAHNQYLAFAIKTGIVGMSALLLCIVFSLNIAIRSRSFIYLSFIILFAITCITEDVLESNKGIFFYAFFNSLFVCYYLKRRKAQEASGTISDDSSNDRYE